MGQTLANGRGDNSFIWIIAIVVIIVALAMNKCGAQSVSEFQEYKKIVERDRPKLFFPMLIVKQKKEWPFNVLGIKARITVRRKWERKF